MEESKVSVDVQSNCSTYQKLCTVPGDDAEESSKLSGEEKDIMEEADDNNLAEVTKPSGLRCQFCSTIGVVLQAEVLCENCGYRYCYECLNTLHPRRGPFASHLLQTISRKSEVPVTIFYCPHHDDEHSRQEEVFGHIKELQHIENKAKNDFDNVDKSLEQLQFQYQQESLKTQQPCATLHLKILEAETSALEALQKGFLEAKRELESTRQVKQERLLGVQRELQKFDKLIQLNQTDTSPIIISHEAKKALGSRSEKITLELQGADLFRTSTWACPAVSVKLHSLIRAAIKSVFCPQTVRSTQPNTDKEVDKTPSKPEDSGHLCNENSS